MKLARLTVLLSILVSSVALAAEDDEAAREKARALLDEGNQQFGLENFEGAIEKFEAALEAYDSPKIHVNLAEAYRALGNNAKAMWHYERFLGRGTSKPKVSRRVQKRASEIESSIGRIELSGEHEATVTSGAWSGDWQAGLRVPVAPGTHVFTIRQDGKDDIEERVTVAAGDLAKLEIAPPVVADATPPIDIDAPPPPPPPPPAVVTNPSADDPVTAKWWFWAAIGAVVVVAGVSVVAATTGGDDRLPMGELPTTSTADWTNL